MSRNLAKLINYPDYKLQKVIDKLEALSGCQSEDIKLLSENRLKLRSKLAALGLDPDDTTDAELIHAITAKLARDLKQIHQDLSFAEVSPNREATDKILSLANKYSLNQQVLSIKASSARKLLKTQPPKRLMKLLNYRSLDSMLKREDAKMLFALLPAAESRAWNAKLAIGIKKLNRRDYELRQPEFKSLGSANEHLTRVTYVPLMGAVVLVPGKDLNERALEVIYQMLQAEEILQADTFYLNCHQFSHDFGARAARIFQSDEPPLVKIAGQEFLKWHHLKNLYDDQPSSLERISLLHPLLQWWHETAELAKSEDGTISLHLGDIFKRLYHGYSSDAAFNLNETLTASLLRRYARSPAVKNYIAGQLDDKVISMDSAYEPEALGPELKNEFI